MGEEPVYRSDVKNKEVEDLMLNRLENRGYFYSRVTSDVQVNEKRKESKVTYSVTLEKPYRMAGFTVDSIPQPLLQAILSEQEKSILKPGQRFDLARLKAERERIDAALKMKGYYNFNASFLIFEADTNRYEDRRFDLFLSLKKDVPHRAITPYEIEEIKVYPTVDNDTDSLERQTETLDGVQFIGGKTFFRSDRLAPFITLKPGQLYSAKTSKATARKLSTIGVYRFVNIQYEEMPGDSSSSLGQLKARIELSPLNKRALRVEIQAVSKSNNFAGPALAVTSSNRNLFRGGETLNLSSNVGYEFQVGGSSNLAYNFSLGVRGELVFPRLLLPFPSETDFFKYEIPKTKVTLAVEHSDRSGLYKLIGATAALGYDWNANRFITHHISLISVNYSNLYQTSSTFDTILDNNPFLKKSFDQQFIAGLNYSFTYNELIDARDKNAFFVNLNFETAGNAISLLAGPRSENNPTTVLGLEFAQFAKLDLDLRYHLRFGNGHTLASRIFAGYGLPYGNSEVMPFIKQFYSGGPYGLRAFAIRSIGPGTYDGSGLSDTGLFEQTGNIKLEANLEYRFPLFSFFKGAVFTDVGNVWLSEENDRSPGRSHRKGFPQHLRHGCGYRTSYGCPGICTSF